MGTAVASAANWRMFLKMSLFLILYMKLRLSVHTLFLCYRALGEKRACWDFQALTVLL